MAPVMWTRSDPARSTRLSFPTLTQCVASPPCGPPPILPMPAPQNTPPDQALAAQSQLHKCESPVWSSMWPVLPYPPSDVPEVLSLGLAIMSVLRCTLYLPKRARCFCRRAACNGCQHPTPCWTPSRESPHPSKTQEPVGKVRSIYTAPRQPGPPLSYCI